MGMDPHRDQGPPPSCTTGCAGGCLLGILAALILGAAEILLAGSGARLDFIFALVGIACAVSWVQFLFEGGSRPSGGCAWALMLFVIVLTLVSVAHDHRPPSAVFGLSGHP